MVSIGSMIILLDRHVRPGRQGEGDAFPSHGDPGARPEGATSAAASAMPAQGTEANGVIVSS